MSPASRKALLWIVLIILGIAGLVYYLSQGQVPLGSAVVVNSPLFRSDRIYTGGKYLALVGVEKEWKITLSSNKLGLTGSSAVEATTRDGRKVLVDLQLFLELLLQVLDVLSLPLLFL